ncbi:hypothetical protein VAR608DRAFT_4873 [Variovorax sp. HW608]|uniref:hypothetical protein n=1 Tax=Variovorax sp. HW608 TaxID=1034889 RepID=UPI00081FC7B1|nr:hypothetical protein [Variovorax sp. HW608]SCK49030.1 hypothetical protein VAR608DRAFT_4873 [Variovorax sp. HW608]
MVAEAKSSKDVRIYLSDGSAPISVEVTGVSKSRPAVITAASPAGGWQLGAPVMFQGTGFPELDNHFFTIGSSTGDSFTATGSDTTDSTGSLSSAGAEVLVYDNTDLTPLCLSSFAYALETPGTVDVGTYCNPSATLPATAGAPGTMTLGGYIDVQDSAYPAVYRAVKDGKTRVLSILLGQGQGELIQAVNFVSMTWDIPMGDGGMAWTATANLKSRPEHVWDDTESTGELIPLTEGVAA